MQTNTATSVKVFCATHRAICGPCPPVSHLAASIAPQHIPLVLAIAVAAALYLVSWLPQFKSKSDAIPASIFGLAIGVFAVLSTDSLNAAAMVAYILGLVGLALWWMARARGNRADEKAIRGRMHLQSIRRVQQEVWELKRACFGIKSSDDVLEKIYELEPRAFHLWITCDECGVSVPSTLKQSLRTFADLYEFQKKLESLYQRLEARCLELNALFPKIDFLNMEV